MQPGMISCLTNRWRASHGLHYAVQSTHVAAWHQRFGRTELLTKIGRRWGVAGTLNAANDDAVMRLAA